MLALVWMPGEPRVLFAGTDTRGLFRSEDGGATWRPTPLNDGDVPIVAIDPHEPRVIYAQRVNELFKSVDAGENWLPTALSDYFVTSIAIDPVTPNRLYAAAFDEGVFRSNDGGETWDSVGRGLPFIDSFTLAIDPADSNVVYAASDNDEGIGGVFVSRDGAESWAEAGLQGVRIQDLAIDATRPSRLIAGVGPNNERYPGPPGGVFVTTDGGASWQETGLREGNVTSVVIDPHVSTTVYATVVDASGRPDGVFKSSDDGRTWLPANAGLPNPDVFPALRVVADAAVVDTLYVATAGAGAWRSSDGGASWESIGSGLPLTTFYRVSALAAVEARTAYAGTFDRGIFCTENGGDTWEPASTGLHDLRTDVLAIAVDPNRPAIVYAATLGGVVKSEDSGATWTSIDQGLEGTVTQSLAIDSTNSAVLYALNNAGVFKTTDGGENWYAMNEGLGLFGAIDVLYIDTSTGFFRSTDGASSWQFVAENLPGTELAAQDASTLFAGDPSGVFGTTDGGVTWRQLLSEVYIASIAVSAPTGTVYAAGAGVWRSDDGGTTWRRLDDAVDGHFVHELAVAGVSPTIVYAGTNEGVLAIRDASDGSGDGDDGCALMPVRQSSGVVRWMWHLAIPIAWARSRWTLRRHRAF